MKRLALALIATTLTGCASPQDIQAYAEQTCARLKQYGGAEYDRCIVETTRQCESKNAEAKNLSGCHPHK